MHSSTARAIRTEFVHTDEHRNNSLGQRVSRHLSFLGTQSLPSWVVARGEPEVVQDTGQNHDLPPVQSDSFERSAAAWPFQREGKLAGYLLVESTKEHYFSPRQLFWIEVSANAATLSFRDKAQAQAHRVDNADFAVMDCSKPLEKLGRQRVESTQAEKVIPLDDGGSCWYHTSFSIPILGSIILKR